MTVAANDPLMVHAALDEGAEDKDLVLDLAVREIEVRLQQGQPKALVQGLAGFDLVPDTAAPGMAAGAGLGLQVGVARWLATGFPGLGGKPQVPPSRSFRSTSKPRVGSSVVAARAA